MKYLRLFLALGIITIAGFFLLTTQTFASEGLVELRSTTREASRCFASSILMQDQNFNVLVSCRELIYPAGNTVFTYVLWAQPVDGGNPKRLGELGYGRLSARTNVPFNQLFVTTETTGNVGKPGGPVVMRGNVSPITFLDRSTTPTPTSATTINSGTTGTPEPGASLTPTPGESTGSKIATAFKRAGLAALLALLAIIGLVFAITRSKG